MVDPISTLKRFLVVDDEPHVRTATRLLLAAVYEAEVTEARSGREALEILSRETFDLIATDYLMPEMDGIKLAAAVRRNHPDLPIVMITAFPEEAARPENVADHILAKPFQIRNLKEAVETAVGRRGQRSGK